MLRERTDIAWLVAFTTSGQKTEWVYSFNSAACMGQTNMSHKAGSVTDHGATQPAVFKPLKT